jgi:Transposase, Mutator family
VQKERRGDALQVSTYQFPFRELRHREVLPRGSRRGLRGVRLVISDAHEGLRQAIAKILHEACWQRCRVHFMRNLLSTVPKQATVAAEPSLFVVHNYVAMTTPQLRAASLA